MIWSALLVIIGLSLFEAISSVDNAIINAEVLSTMSARARRWFLTWGIFIAVFLVRGALPFLIIWAFNASLSPAQIFSAAWSSNPLVHFTGGRRSFSFVFISPLALFGRQKTWLTKNRKVFYVQGGLVLCCGFYFTCSYFLVCFKRKQFNGFWRRGWIFFIFHYPWLQTKCRSAREKITG
jgi:predicted tellurium resistance membrane protein TerC